MLTMGTPNMTTHYDKPSIWKYHIRAGMEGVEGSGIVKPDIRRLFIPENRTELIDELKEEFKELNPDFYDRKDKEFWNSVWWTLLTFQNIRIDCGRDPLKGYMVIYVDRFLQMQEDRDNHSVS